MADSEPPDAAPTSVPPPGARLRRVPKIAASALKLVRQAGRRHLLLSTILSLVAGLGIAAQLLVVRRALYKLQAVSTGQADVSELALELGLLVGATLIIGAFGALAAYHQRMLQELVAARTLDHIIDTATIVDLQSFESPTFHDQLERAKTSGLGRPLQLVTSISTITTSLLTSVGIGVALFAMQPLLLPLVLIAGVPVLLATLGNSRAAYEFEYLLTPQARERYYLLQLFTERQPAKEIRVFNSTRFLRKRYDALTRERIVRLREFQRRRLVVTLIATAAGGIAGALALGALGLLLAADRIDIPTAVTAGVAMQLLAGRLAGLTSALGQLVESGIFLDDFYRFMDLGKQAADERSDLRAVSPTYATGDAPKFQGVRAEHVSFTYPETTSIVLDDVSVHIDPGEMVALVGENGSGKTTLVKLICQLYQPTAGQVMWNGEDAAYMVPEETRDDVTVIFQDFIQYHLTAEENITLGRVERPAEASAVLDAARQAGADGYVQRLPRGFQTRLGREFEGGTDLSIGQWQRLALARAFYRGGRFLVLDEPTAALDPRAEHELFSQMRALSAGRTVLLVSHRFSSVRTADRIYVMDRGRVIEHGSHEELVDLDGHYAELFRLQAAAYLDVRS